MEQSTPSRRMVTAMSPKRGGEEGPDPGAPEAQALLMPADSDALLPAQRPWIEEGPVATALGIGREERRVVSSINRIMDEMEERRRGTERELRESKGEAAALRKQCEELRNRLEITTQRLELAVSHSVSQMDADTPRTAANKAFYEGRSGAALAQDDKANVGWLMGIFSRSKTRTSL